jgi:hypothetical protein
MRGFSLTQGAVRFLSQSGKRFGLLGACTFGLERLTLSGPRVLGALTWPGIVEHEEEPHECDQRVVFLQPADNSTDPRIE